MRTAIFSRITTLMHDSVTARQQLILSDTRIGSTRCVEILLIRARSLVLLYLANLLSLIVRQTLMSHERIAKHSSCGGKQTTSLAKSGRRRRDTRLCDKLLNTMTSSLKEQRAFRSDILAYYPTKSSLHTYIRNQNPL